MAKKDVIKKQAVVEEVNLLLITEKADLENEKVKTNTVSECVMAVYKKNHAMGNQWQNNCTRQNHFITDLFVKLGDNFSN